MVRGGRQTKGSKGYEGQTCADVLLEASKESITVGEKPRDIHDKWTRRRDMEWRLVNVVH